MTSLSTHSRVWWMVGRLTIAGAAGYLIARATSPAPPSPMKPEAAVRTEAHQTHLDVKADYLKIVGIELEAARGGNLSATIRAPATVATSPMGAAVVTARASGTLVVIRTRLGNKVRAGDTLAIVESREAAAIASERDVARAKVTLAQTVFDREKKLFEERVTPRQDYESAQAQLAAAQAEARRTDSAFADAHVSNDGRRVEVKTPLTGQITALHARLGNYVQADSELFRVSDRAAVEIHASVTAADAARLTAGDLATVINAAGSRFPAKVASVASLVDDQTRSATVVLHFLKEVSTEGSAIPTPGEFVQAVIHPKAVEQGLLIPEEAVQKINGRDAVFARTAEGFDVESVNVGARSEGSVLIISGIQAGQVIAARNAFLLKAELGKSVEEDE